MTLNADRSQVCPMDTVILLQLADTYVFHFFAVYATVCFKGVTLCCVWVRHLLRVGTQLAAAAIGSSFGEVCVAVELDLCRLRDLGLSGAAECGTGRLSGPLRFTL